MVFERLSGRLICGSWRKKPMWFQSRFRKNKAEDMLLLAKLIVEESGGMTTEWDNYVLLSGKSLTREIKNLVEIKHWYANQKK